MFYIYQVQEDLSKSILDAEGVSSVNFISDSMARFNDTIKSIYNIVLTLIVSVIGTAEVDMVMFGRQIYPLSFIIASILTLAFSWFVNIVMLRKLRKINMVEALKTVE